MKKIKLRKETFFHPRKKMYMQIFHVHYTSGRECPNKQLICMYMYM